MENSIIDVTEAGKPKTIRHRWFKTACVMPVVLSLLTAACGGSDLPPVTKAENTSYRLDSGDKVRIVVFGQDQMSDEYTVGDDGTISLPLVGQVKARGLSTAQLEAELKGQLERGGVLVNPSVTAEIETFRPFFILGEVAKPGQYPYVSGMTVLTAVAIAGGFTYRADKSKVSITRNAQGKAVEGLAQRIDDVAPGDVIVVDERFF